MYSLPQNPIHPLKVIPLGGLGEIGMNMMLFEYEGSVIIVDAGLMFPANDMFGIDIVIPDFSYLRDPAKTVLGLFLTHGHEDHIGAVPYLLREMNLPIYGTPLTVGFVSEKLKEHRMDLLRDETGLPCRPKLISIKTRDPIFLGPFRIEAMSVTHSVSDSVAYAITTPAGCVIHTGDFKIDSTPVGGGFFDVERFSEYGDKGVLALFSDSTNAERKGHTPSETEVSETFDDLFSNAEGRIIVSTFSSNIDRIDQIARIAARHGRKIFFSGKSIVENTRIAREIGYLSFPLDQTTPLEGLHGTPDSQVAIITTGSQGEPMSALFRMATDDHKQIRIKPGDTVILSARVIPGNEENISRVINLLFKKGARVLHEGIAPVHVSGHACQEEQKKVLEWTRPRFFIPVHGEFRQLVSHAAVAKEAGLPPERIVIIEDGESILLTAHGCERSESVPAEKICIDGKGIGDVEKGVLKDRLHLGSDGMVIITLTLEKSGRKILAGPAFLSRGFTSVGPGSGNPASGGSPSLWEEMESSLHELFRQMEGEREWEEPVAPHVKIRIETEIQKTLKKLISKKMNRYPMIIPNIIVV